MIADDNNGTYVRLNEYEVHYERSHHPSRR